MVIKDISLTRTKDGATLSATCKLRKIGWDTIYMTLQGSKHHDYIFEDASPFAAALLLPSMKQGEDLIIKGSISEELYNGMQEIMKVVLAWNVGLKPIKIKADKLVKDKQTKNTHVASTFSGGVDSFYTYLKHKKDRKKSDRIDSFVLVKGFDVDLRNDDLWKTTLKNVRAIAKKESIELLTVETNARVIMEPIMPRGELSHGGCLAGIGLALRNGINKLYIPATFSAEQQLPWGSHMDVDPHWSTEKLQFIHDGTEATRLDKIVWEVSKSPVAYEHLRVCYMNEKGQYNCGVCDKCVRTMIHFYVAGALDKVKTFPHEIDLDRVAAGPHVVGDGTYITWGEQQNLQGLRERNMDPELQQALETSLVVIANMRTGFTGKAKLQAAKAIQEVVYLDFAYAGSTLYRPLSKAFGRKFD
jgi:hypothetical protein